MNALIERELFDTQTQSLIRSLVWLWHDYLEESHHLSQDIPSTDGSFLHAIMHRREPDYWNAKYWFDRVGRHPSFPEIARRAGDLMRQANERDLAAKLFAGGQWDPRAF